MLVYASSNMAAWAQVAGTSGVSNVEIQGNVRPCNRALLVISPLCWHATLGTAPWQEHVQQYC
jgi:hypothetical protein